MVENVEIDSKAGMSPSQRQRYDEIYESIKKRYSLTTPASITEEDFIEAIKNMDLKKEREKHPKKESKLFSHFRSKSTPTTRIYTGVLTEMTKSITPLELSMLCDNSEHFGGHCQIDDNGSFEVVIYID